MRMQKKSLLITRPEPENALSMAFFTEHGLTCFSLPMLKIQSFQETSHAASIQSKILDIDLYDVVICVSKNAAREAAYWLDRCWPMLPEKVLWIGIGHGTTKLLQEEGIPARTNLGQTTEDLLKWPILDDLIHKKVLIMRGEGGRTELSKQLEARGATVNHLALYQRLTPEYTDVELSKVENTATIIITSGEGLENLNRCLALHKKIWSDKTIITPSQRVAEMAIVSGWQNVIQANGADDRSILQAIDCLQDE